MKLKKIKELFKLSNTELEKELEATQEAIYKLRFQKIVGEVPNVNLIKNNKRKIARIKTILTIREKERQKIALEEKVNIEENKK